VESLDFPPPTMSSVPPQHPVYVPTPVDESAVFSPIPPESQVPTLRPRGHADALGAPPEQFVHAAAMPGTSTQSPLIDADPDLVTALQEVVFSGASDLHITNNAVPMLRVDGSLRPVTEDVIWNRAKVTTALLSILTPQQQETFARELEFDFAYTISANARFRVNFYQQRGAIGAAFRLIPTEIKKLDQLGVPDAVERFAHLAWGLVLVTGPTGSGKSTTLAALIDLINRTRADHIVTVEDPIEFLHGNQMSLVNQREVGSDTHSFANALKHVLRQDPDVILIGELRDLETISVALTAAETGHLVFAPSTRRMPRRRSTASSTCSLLTSSRRCERSSRRPCRASSARPWSSARAAQGVPWPPRCSSPRRPSPTSSERARPTRSPRRCRRVVTSACTRWTSTWPSS
jgi:twitching motility protein PilT